jgi:hypothetical protein
MQPVGLNKLSHLRSRVLVPTTTAALRCVAICGTSPDKKCQITLRETPGTQWIFTWCLAQTILAAAVLCSLWVFWPWD